MIKPKITKRAMRVLQAHKRGEVHNKRIVEKFFLDTVSAYIRTPTTAMKLTGFDYTYYAKEFFKNHFADNLCVVERETYVFNEIYKKALKCPWFNLDMVNLIKGDIGRTSIDIKCRYIDLDIMEKIDYVLPVVRKVIQNQRQLEKNHFAPKKEPNAKAISFTCSIRNGGTPQHRFDKLQAFLHEEFDADLIGFNDVEAGFCRGVDADTFHGSTSGRQGVYVKQFTPNFSDMGDIFSFQLLNYSDSAHFQSALIIYK
jgi:hypothetical protein